MIITRSSPITTVVRGLIACSALIPFAAAQALDAPVLSCFSSTENTITLQVCGGATTGAPAGFSIHWLTLAQYQVGPDETPGTGDDNSFGSGDENCAASFSGHANNSNWDLGPGACVTLVIGGLNDTDPGVSFSCNDPLACNTAYVFRAFAHASTNPRKKRSAFTDAGPLNPLQCTTDSCEPTGFNDGDHCTKSQGYFGSGNDSRGAMIACFGGDPTGVACTSVAGPLLTIGGGVYTYTWSMTGTCVDILPSPVQIFRMDSGLAALRQALGGGGGSSFFTANGNNATNMGTGGGLASQTAALTLNLQIAAFGQCAASTCTDGSAGDYADAELCNFEEGDTFVINGTPILQATADALNGQTVADVLAEANAYLGGNGAVAVPYGLSVGDFNELVANLNLAFDLKDWDGDEVDDCACGGMTAFAESHLCKP